MIAFIKSVRTYQTLLAAEVVSYDLPIATTGGDSGRMFLRGTDAAGNEGNWLAVDSRIWLIKSISISAGLAALTLSPPISAFDRPLFYSGTYASTELFVFSQLNKEFKNCTDSFYAMPYLDLNYDTSTPFAAPTLNNEQMFSLTSYLQQINSVFFDSDGSVAQFGVVCDFTDAGSTLRIDIRKIGSRTRHAFFDNNRFALISQAHDDSLAAKVTILAADGTTTDCYLMSWGGVSTAPQADLRVRGKWLYAQEVEDETAINTARKIFASNRGDHKVEFYSTEEFALHEIVMMRLEGYAEPQSYEITCIRISSSDERYRYTCGDMPTTLTDNVGRAVSLASAEKASPADYIVARGKTGIWQWEKYASGVAKCWGVYSGSNINAAKNHYMGWYYSDPIAVELPFEFTAVPTVVVSGGGYNNLTVARTAPSTTTSAGVWILALDQYATAVSVSVDIMVKGKWK